MPGPPMSMLSVAAHRADNMDRPWQAADEHAAAKWRDIPSWMFETPRPDLAAKAAKAGIAEPTNRLNPVTLDEPKSALTRNQVNMTAQSTDQHAAAEESKTVEEISSVASKVEKGKQRAPDPADNEQEIGTDVGDHISKDESASERTIAVNDRGERVDIELPRPSGTDNIAFSRLTIKPCFSHHLGGGQCKRMPCRNSHEPIDEAIRKVLTFKARRFSCRKGRACRNPACYWGHTCQMAVCGIEKAWTCKLPAAMHRRKEIAGFEQV